MAVLDIDNLTEAQSERFTAVAAEVRQRFNEIVEAASTPHLHDIDWIVSSVASRNRYISPLYLRLCTLEFVERELAALPDVDTIVLADRLLARHIERSVRGRSVRVVCTEGVGRRWWRVTRPLRQYLLSIGGLTLRWLGRSKAGRRVVLNQRDVTLVDTFVLNNRSGDEGSIVGGRYKDRYYPGLLENLSDEQRARVFFLPTVIGFWNAIRIFREIRQSSFPFVLHDDFLKTVDYLFALSHPFRLMRRAIPRVDFNGADVTDLLRQENFANSWSANGQIALLYFRFARRLAEQQVGVRLLIDWYENQVIDRAMIVGFRRWHPRTRIIGYQGYVIAKSLHLYTNPNATEWRGRAVPDVVAVVGAGLMDGLHEFCKDVTVGVGPGFRFQKLWRDRVFFPDPDVFTVLVGLPIHLGDSAHILRLLAASLPSLGGGQIRFRVKPHPTAEPARIRALLPDPWPAELEVTIGDFHDSLEKCNLLISNASSVTLEALAKGVPVVVVGAHSGIDQNPIPRSVSSDLWTLVRTPDQLAAAIRRFEAERRAATRDLDEIGRELRARFFAPVTRQSVAQFLGLSSS